MENRRLPILGNNFPGDRTCTRMIVGGKCGKPGHWHVIWEDCRASVACLECGEDVRRGYVHVEMHLLSDACTSPAGMWFRGDHTCRLPIEDDDYDRGRYLVGY